MNSKHREAFRKLRQWCEEYNAEIYLEDTEEIFINFLDSKVYCLEEVFNKNRNSVIELAEVFSEDKTFNFMEQEKDG